VQSGYKAQVHEGMEVLDRDGQKIGMCGETLGEYFNVDAGFLGTAEYYIPFSAIREVSDSSVVVNVRKDEIDTMGWNERPTETTSDTATTTEADRTLQLKEEQLQARKTAVETGRVHVGKDVVEEQRTLEVPVSREEAYIERHPVDRRPADQGIDETESETIRVPVREEQVEVEKQPVVYEEVGVGKRVSQESRQVSDTVRREELRIENEGDVEVRDNPNP
jgi:uncharacterized protein (TIGR02271 family)